MNKLEVALLHASTFLLTATGIVYAYMRYGMQPTDPFSVVNHPWEPHMLSAHILVAPLLVVAVGLIAHAHILVKLGNSARLGRTSGITMIFLFVLMVVSGYLLQVITSEIRKVIVVIHLSTGTLWFISYVTHQVMSYRSRRMNLRRVGVICLCFLFSIAAIPRTVAKEVEAEKPVEREVYAMGTMLNITLYSDDRARGIQAIESLVRVVEQTEDQLSTWRSGSELSRLNRQKTNVPFAASPELFDLLLRLQQWTLATQNAFDPAVGRLIEVWGIHDRRRAPSDAELTRALQETGFQYLHLSPDNLQVTKLRSIVLDAGAFGKGEALDRALTLAKREHFGALMMDFGGQIASNFSPEGKGWKVSIANPRSRLQSSAVSLLLDSGSYSTSGASEKGAHILDPATGKPAPDFGSVTVWHPQSLVADILSTALYVMGPEKGYRWAMEKQVAACFLIVNGDHTEIRKTQSFR